MHFSPGQHIHFVGIGGYGMSAIARILLERGYTVSGSDRTPNALTAALARDGATIYAGHDASNITGADMLIVTSAVNRASDHPEIGAAQAAGIPVYRRRDIMAALMEGHYVIAVAGTHGKTTTTAMIVHLLRTVGVDASYIVGGVMKSTGTNAGVGSDDVFVIEADEYDHMFLGLRPNMIVLTSIEFDHPDYFESVDDVVSAFRQFVALLPAEHAQLIACTDYPLVQQVAADFPGTVGAYGFEPPVIFHPADVVYGADGVTSFAIEALDVNSQTLEKVGQARLKLAGRHNVLNATAALFATIMEVAGRPRILAKHVYDALESFEGTGRRLEERGTVGGVTVIDDYAHHPTAIREVLWALSVYRPDRPLWAVWQPHTFSRTSALLDDYAAAFGDADHVLVTDVFAAREQPPAGQTVSGFSAQVAAAIQHPDVTHTPSLDDAVRHLLAHVTGEAAIVIMSAGDAPKIGEAFLREREGGAS
jgi:UDP-N-acetylmuramate--alanine ligase